VLTLIGGPCTLTSGGPAANGASFPSFSLEKVLTPGSLACVARLWCRLSLFGCESWTVADAMWTALKGVHHQNGGHDGLRGPCGGWIYPPLEEALKKAGLCTMEHCVSQRQQRTVDHISTRPVWAHCMAARRKPGTSPKTVCQCWWDQKRRQAKPVDEHWEDGTPCL